jgi:phenylglyoxylate dehydrogenase alpha subunit
MSKVMVMNGNKAAAVGAMLSRPEVIAAYPITPQTPIVEFLTEFVANGELDSVISEVESEHSAMSVVTGASLAGSRVFTATSSQGLALMYEPYFRASTLRLPIVMAIVNREMISPQTVWGGPQDSLTLRDAGWIQIYVEDNQEILDMIIQAYKIAENNEVLLPVNICYDGFYLSHMTEKVIVPDQEDVDRFLSPYNPIHI